MLYLYPKSVLSALIILAQIRQIFPLRDDISPKLYESSLSFLAHRKYVGVIADFSMSSGDHWRVMKKKIPGILLDNGNFIFYLDYHFDGEKKLVLTSNSGHFIKSGFMKISSHDWMNPSKWSIPYQYKYRVENFHGFEGNFCIKILILIFIFH